MVQDLGFRVREGLDLRLGACGEILGPSCLEAWKKSAKSM